MRLVYATVAEEHFQEEPIRYAARRLLRQVKDKDRLMDLHREIFKLDLYCFEANEDLTLCPSEKSWKQQGDSKTQIENEAEIFLLLQQQHGEAPNRALHDKQTWNFSDSESKQNDQEFELKVHDEDHREELQRYYRSSQAQRLVVILAYTVFQKWKEAPTNTNREFLSGKKRKRRASYWHQLLHLLHLTRSRLSPSFVIWSVF